MSFALNTNYTYRFCDAVLLLKHEYIYMPAAPEAKEIARRIEARCGFPQVMGSIDGTHIPILPPKENKKDLMNCKFWASFVLQAVVDDRYW